MAVHGETMKQKKTITTASGTYPAIIDEEGTLRFPTNAIVRFLLDSGHVDMNQLWMHYSAGLFNRKDLQAFYRLIGYSECGYYEVFEDEIPEDER